MKFSDLFVPKYLHSNPDVRLKFVESTDDWKLLEQIANNDQDNDVKKSAAERAQVIKEKQQIA
ncbi:MAG: hypothetical protein GY729_17085 [Desulfobacteraceae bacterium]|nr:hypothetical protein [Desulfobacteraceae bacterium]